MVSTDRKLQEGMSGAWIVDSDTTELVGHLIAVSATSPWGYFIPIIETIEDMKATLNASNVRLPQEGTVETHPAPGPIEHVHSVSSDIQDNGTGPQPNSSDSQSAAQPHAHNRDRAEGLDEAITAVTPAQEPQSSHLSREQTKGLSYPPKSEVPEHTTGATPGINPRESPGSRLWRKLAKYPSKFRIPWHRDRPEPIGITPWEFSDGLMVREERWLWSTRALRSDLVVPLSTRWGAFRLSFSTHWAAFNLSFATRLELIREAVELSPKASVWIYLLLVLIKLWFEMLAGTITAMVVAMKINTTRRAFIIGMFGGSIRWLVVDVLPSVLCFLMMIIQVLVLGKGGNHRFIYFIIVTLCLSAYPLVVFVTTIRLFSELHLLRAQVDREKLLLVGWSVAGLPAIGVLLIVLNNRTRGIPQKTSFAGGVCASIWATNNFESGYIIGEATTGAILGSFLWISGGFIAPHDAAAAGAVYGTIVLGKLVICSIARGAYEVREQLRTMAVVHSQGGLIVPWWWWRHHSSDSPRRLSSHWLLNLLIGSRNFTMIHRQNIRFRHAPPPLWLRFLSKVSTIQKPPQWVHDEENGMELIRLWRGIELSSRTRMRRPRDHDVYEIPDSEYPAFIDSNPEPNRSMAVFSPQSANSVA
ncbi:hypothetical protein K440DRAFT_664081 [Wilcoxina mikolae CBS 423.85]|nr:hypothetical protein K440DRAFT_664081 [Wilcoxina mikolae CBS 423.85]